jgi:hypothetical protein
MCYLTYKEDLALLKMYFLYLLGLYFQNIGAWQKACIYRLFLTLKKKMKTVVNRCGSWHVFRLKNCVSKYSYKLIWTDRIICTPSVQSYQNYYNLIVSMKKGRNQQYHHFLKVSNIYVLGNGRDVWALIRKICLQF